MGQQRNSSNSTICSRALNALPAILLFIIMLFSSTARADDKDMVLERSGIKYPGGYDHNTFGEIKGNANSLVIPDAGPVTFNLTGQNEFYTVIAAPGWYWNQSGFSVSDGSVVIVRGSKSLGRDSRLYIIAQTIKNESTGKTLTIRGKDGKPVWSGNSHMPGPGPRTDSLHRTMQKGPGSGGRHKRSR